MNADTDAIQCYRSQIVRCAQSLAIAHNDLIVSDLFPGTPLERVTLFTEGNFEKRFLKLKDQMDLLEDAFDDLDERINAYISTVPLAAYDTGSSDLELFLDRLCDTHHLTAEQYDCVTCQKSRIAVEHRAANNRMGHVWFQELFSRAADFATELETNPLLWVTRNPISIRATFYSHALLDEDEAIPANVMFFPVGNDIRTAILEPDAAQVIRELERNGPVRLDELDTSLPGLNREQIVETCREFADIGLAAFG
jgi:hypothetical protein